MTAAAPAARRLGQVEFTALLAMLFATIAFSIDAMLPSLPTIAAELAPDAPNRAQLIISAFVLGMGIGTFLSGPLSDAIGRKPVIAGGILIYVAAALAAHVAPDLHILLAARIVQGMGAAGPRIAGMALTRDLYEGREMARVMSFVMMVFMIVPAVAPMIGQTIVQVWGWRAIFLAFVLFGLFALTWMSLRQPETHAAAARRPLSLPLLMAGLAEVLSVREVRFFIAAMTLGFGQMMALLSSIQQIFDVTYGRAVEFPYWFALIAALSACASFTNSRLVMRVGMRRLAAGAFLGQSVLSVVMVTVFSAGLLQGTAAFSAFFLWATSVFFIAGLTFGNLNALAMQKLGHIAGMATSVITAISTMLAVAVAAPVGLAFNGTPVPAMIGAAICSTAAFLLVRASGR